MSGTHEDFGREMHGSGPSDRNFGFVFTAFFLLLALWPLRHGRPVRLWSLALSVACFLVTMVQPRLLHTFNRVWTHCGVLLGKVVNPIVTTLLFFLVFTPVALILRVLGKETLRLKTEPEARSYWIERSGSNDLSDMSNQF
jgi:Saxitoxin biosynthesis operon protein SxtJ